MSDLAERNNPSAWADLLRLALPVIDEASDKIGPFDWSLGGGTAIAGDRLTTLLTAMRRHDADSLSRADIKAIKGYDDLAATAVFEASLFVEGLLGL